MRLSSPPVLGRRETVLFSFSAERQPGHPRHGDAWLSCYGGIVARRHRRFALTDVTFAGGSLPGATMDCWEDDSGHAQWSARVVTRTGPILDEGELAGKTADGRLLSGHVLVADRQIGAGGRRETLVEFHGSGDLQGLSDLPT
jgi:hypothetical protein